MTLFIGIYLLIGCFMTFIALITDKNHNPIIGIMCILLGPGLFVICTVIELIKVLTKGRTHH